MMKITCFHKEEKDGGGKSKPHLSLAFAGESPARSAHHLHAALDEPIKKVRNMYYISILIKGRTLSSLKSAMRQSPIFEENDIIIDVDPM